jgi:2,4-dienoyl-CoA reductase-like NADH-dependent reductase (Old Yellow Enzyme family)
LAPSALPHLSTETPPTELDALGLEHIKQSFVKAAERAAAMGIEVVELHGAHGYLLHEFLSPISNLRTDAYGGSFENRIRFVMEIFESVRAKFQGVLGVRLSATDWLEGGWNPEETASLSVRLQQAGANFVHISSGGISPHQKIAIGPEYQVPFAKQVKDQCGLPTMAVGLITQAQQAEAILQRGDADLIALARAFLFNPAGLGKLLPNWEAQFKPANNTGGACPKKRSPFLAMFALHSVKLNKIFESSNVRLL